jgi:tetratricopeptide (TPR) repeat protein
VIILKKARLFFTSFLLTGIILTMLPGCSTKKNSFTRRAYHNLTAHYNAYWNGRESFKEGLRELNSKVEDNYADILPIFKYGDKATGKSLAPQMDRAIEKGKKVINRHSMNFRGKEYVRWIDDSWLMIGEAHFYKHEYLKARRIFERIVQEFDGAESAEAMLWLGRTFTQLNYYGRASSTFDQVQSIIESNSGEINSYTRSHLPLMVAEWHMKQENHQAAVPYLLNAVPMIKDKELKTRILFILGQLYQEADRGEEAASYFREVIKRNPTYEMSFNARIRLATASDVTDGDADDMVEELHKMLKDFKNNEYKDQIYYALAQIALKQEKDTLAISYLKKSVANSISNDFQRASSSLQLAELLFDRQNYPVAKKYYDSAVQVIPYDYPNYSQIIRKTNVLGQLVENIQTIETQDSLQRVASMPENERNIFIDSLIQAYQKEQARLQEIEQQQGMSMQPGGFRANQNMNPAATGGGWYFYNSQALSSGYNQFLQKWGRRKLEDNWRLSNKKQAAVFGSDEEEMMAADSTMADSAAIAVSTDPLKRETYLQYLPKTPEQFQASDSLIAKALYHLGFIYKIQLQNKSLAVDAFEKFIERFPEHQDAVKVYYQLYVLYDELNETDKSELIKQTILSQYPDSDYALILQDPDYLKNLMASKDRIESMYEEAWSAFKNQSYFTAKIICDDALNNYQETELTPNYKYIRAVSISKMEENRDTLQVALRDLVKTYPKSDVYPLAQNILRKIAKDADTLTQEQKRIQEEEARFAKAKEAYVAKKNAPHFYILMVDSKNVDVSATKYRLSDHNKKYFKEEGLKISSIVFDKKIHMITVTNFENSTEAMTYFNTLADNDYVFANISPKDYKHFIIAAENYPVFYRSKNLSDYIIYFRKTYLEKDSYPTLGELE